MVDKLNTKIISLEVYEVICQCKYVLRYIDCNNIALFAQVLVLEQTHPQERSGMNYTPTDRHGRAL